MGRIDRAEVAKATEAFEQAGGHVRVLPTLQPEQHKYVRGTVEDVVNDSYNDLDGKAVLGGTFVYLAQKISNGTSAVFFNNAQNDITRHLKKGEVLRISVQEEIVVPLEQIVRGYVKDMISTVSAFSHLHPDVDASNVFDYRRRGPFYIKTDFMRSLLQNEPFKMHHKIVPRQAFFDAAWDYAQRGDKECLLDLEPVYYYNAAAPMPVARLRNGVPYALVV